MGFSPLGSEVSAYVNVTPPDAEPEAEPEVTPGCAVGVESLVPMRIPQVPSW